MIGSKKLFFKMSDVIVQIFQKILNWKFECIPNLLIFSSPPLIKPLPLKAIPPIRYHMHQDSSILLNYPISREVNQPQQHEPSPQVNL